MKGNFGNLAILSVMLGLLAVGFQIFLSFASVLDQLDMPNLQENKGTGHAAQKTSQKDQSWRLKNFPASKHSETDSINRKKKNPE